MNQITLEIEKFVCPFHIGCSEAERSFPQFLELTITYSLSNDSFLRSDRLSDTVDYMEVMSQIRSFAKDQRWNLLERLTSDLCVFMLTHFQKIDSVTVSCRKNVSPDCKGITSSCSMVRE